MALDQDVLRSDYAHLLTLWTSGVRDYHTAKCALGVAATGHRDHA